MYVTCKGKSEAFMDLILKKVYSIHSIGSLYGVESILHSVGSLPVLKIKCSCGAIGQQKWLGSHLGEGFGEACPHCICHPNQCVKATNLKRPLV